MGRGDSGGIRRFWGSDGAGAKILIWHESPAYLFAALSLVLIALATAPATRRYAR